MKIGPLWIGSARTHDRMRELVLRCVNEHLGPTVDFGGVKFSRELIPHILHEADGALVLTRRGKKLRIARPHVDTFVVTEVRE